MLNFSHASKATQRDGQWCKVEDRLRCENGLYESSTVDQIFVLCIPYYLLCGHLVLKRLKINPL
jgi:hypothetical protein